MIKERPILFSAPMVCAILDGRKTQTRRIINRINGIGLITDLQISDTAGYDWAMRDKRMRWHDLKNADLLVRCPHGKPGDRLWARETWSKAKSPMSSDLFYRADGESNGKQYLLSFVERESRWRPSIHMPRSASRILLEVTNVRVERLQDISENDAIAEGVVIPPPYIGIDTEGNVIESETISWMPSDFYKELWESINGPGSWDLNPLVWVVEFRVLRTTRAAASE